VFDPETIAHRANFKNCLEVYHPGINHDLYPIGIEYVIVNGVVAAEHGKLTGAMSGQVLRHKPPSA
jgi:N-acyl-D-amino-acid deacylase